MKFSRLFSGKPYHEIEKNADALCQNGEYGFAKLEYEKALIKLVKKTPETPGARDHIEAKIVKCRDALALEHKETAENLTETGLHEEAEDLLKGQIRHTASAYLTFVALGSDGKPTKVPGLMLETEEEIRRNREACDRRDLRLKEKRREKAHQGRAHHGST